MFIKTVSKKTNSGIQKYYYLVRSVRKENRVIHENLASLADMDNGEIIHLIDDLKEVLRFRGVVLPDDVTEKTGREDASQNQESLTKASLFQNFRDWLSRILKHSV